MYWESNAITSLKMVKTFANEMKTGFTSKLFYKVIKGIWTSSTPLNQVNRNKENKKQKYRPGI